MCFWLLASHFNPAGMCFPAGAKPFPLFTWRFTIKSGRNLLDLAAELTRQLGTKQDMIVPSTMMHFSTDERGRSEMTIETKDGARPFGITELAKRQLSEKLGIPFPYFDRMREEQPVLLDRNVNTWLAADENGTRMVRTLDGNVRALLSDRYRRLDNYDLMEHVLPILRSLPNSRVESAELTETKLYVKVVAPHLEFEMAPGDVVQAGVVVTNSEVGHGSLSVQPLIYRLVCRNGLTAVDQSLRKNHVGRSMDSSPDVVTLFKDDTMEAEDRAFFLKVRDVVQAAVSHATFISIARRMQRTIGIPLAAPLKAVEALGTKYLLNETERNGVLAHLIAGKDLSAYGLVNAVTHYSQEVTDYDRASEFESIGGKLVELPEAGWAEMARAAA